MWARAGAPVEVEGYEQGLVTARVTTLFASPKTLTVRGACDGVVYEPSEPEVDAVTPAPTLGSAALKGSTLDLHATAGGAPFVTLTVDPQAEFGLDVVERATTFLRVRATVGDVDIDAWVPVGQVDEGAESAGMGDSIGLRGFGVGGSSYRGEIVRDAPLFVGNKPRPLDGAFVEKGAAVYLDAGEETVDGHVYVPFTFVDDLIEAPGSSHLWVAKDAVHL